MYAVIMAGGGGTRLWPLSRPETPKPFLPLLGDRSLLQEIDKAGGPGVWNPGDLPAEVNSENYQRQVWKMIKGWTETPQRAPRVWLACGVEDRLFRSARLMAKALPQDRFVELPGGHTWEAWINGGKTVFSKIRSES